MPNFKPKNLKKILKKKQLITLDNKHSEMINMFDSINNNTIPKLKHEKYQLNEKLDTEELSISDILNIKDQIKTINRKIKQYKKNERNYYLNNSKLIFEYFEHKKKVSEGVSKKKILNSFFNKKEPTVDLDKEIPNNPNQQFLMNMDEKYIDINNYTINYNNCECGGELVPIDHEGIQVCKICHKQTSYLIEHEKPSYKEPPKEVVFYAYKRINHFREIIAQFQGKETTQIPPEVIQNIKAQIKKERITIDQITNSKAKNILKKLGYNKYYEHIPFIKDKLGIKPPVMRPELEEKLCNLFLDIQKPYAKHCPEQRVNFLNYYYVLYKMCELLGENTFLPHFPMLKDRVKRIEQDEIWKKICKELQWEFIPTL